MRKTLSKAVALLLVAGMILSFTAVASAATTQYATTAVNVRSGPGTRYAILGYLEKGQTITATGTVIDGWTQVQFSKYEIGYVSGQYLKPCSAQNPGNGSCRPDWGRNVTLRVSPENGDIYYATTGLNVRSGPGTKYSIVGGLERYQKATRIGKSGNWYKLLTQDGRDAYASASYLRLYQNGSQSTGDNSCETVAGSGETYYATTGLNMRRGPSSREYSVIYTLKRGEAVTFLGRTYGKWMLVRNMHGREGWCYSSYLTTRGSASNRGYYYCPQCGQVIYHGCNKDHSCGNDCGGNFDWGWGCAPGVVAGQYYTPNYKVDMNYAPSSRSYTVCTLDTDDVVRVENVAAGSSWVLVRIKDTSVCGYVPVDAIK